MPDSGNLLQNSDFQSDWLCLMPENKTLVWCYHPDYFNRRDFNPDGWLCKGNWRWDNADAPPGDRRLLLQGASTVVSQAVNWAVVFDDTILPPRNQIAEDGAFPLAQSVASSRPLRLVRDLTLRVRVRGQAVPAGAGRVELRLGKAAVTNALPAGTYDWQWLTLNLPASNWLATAVSTNSGTAWLLPPFAAVRFVYSNAAGSVELGRAELTEPGPTSPNVLSNGGFESVDAAGYPVGWSAPRKLLHFPMKPYYLFQSWHNAISDNRGPVTADSLVTRSGARSLKMIVPAGDEKQVVSDPIVLNQATQRLIEVSAWVKTDRMAMMQLYAIDQNGALLPGYNVMQKSGFSPLYFTTVADSDWHLVRQVFRANTNAPLLQSIRLQLCARGVNGFTLDDTGELPQNNVVGTIWWDDVRVYEPESTASELAARGVVRGANAYAWPGIQIADFDLGERLIGANVIKATLLNPGPAQPFSLRWRFTSPGGRSWTFTSAPQAVPAGGRVPFQVPYELTECVSNAYTECRGVLEVLNYAGIVAASNALWFTPWTTPIDIQLGALYPAPDQTNLYVRLNIGLSAAAMATADKARLEIVRRATGEVTNALEIAADPAAIAAQRDRVPAEVYDDCRNLLLADIGITMLPIQPFNDPQRTWYLRVSVLDSNRAVLARADSDPFCRLAHDPPQPAMTNVVITTNGLMLIDGNPWMPWGRIYQNAPVYSGPADPGAGKYRSLKNLPAWSLYGCRFGLATMTREKDDFNVLRYYCTQTSRTPITNDWAQHNLAVATAYPFAYAVWSIAEMYGKMGGQAACDSYLSWASNAPMVASLSPGIEESFALFVPRTTNEIEGLKSVTEYIRARSGKPTMVSHGGYWNRFEFERVSFFDIFDPETEPLYPANIHTDLAPFTAGKAKTIWLRSQMYESIPYERWRFHTFVELMRGCRGWQMAQGIGDLSLFRGLRGELEYLKPAAFSTDPGPAVQIEPDMEHWVRRYQGRTYIIAATTRGITLGKWRWADDRPSPAGRSRVTFGTSEIRNDDNSYCMGVEPLLTGPAVHGINWLPDSRVWPAGSRLVQWVCFDPAAPPTNVAFVVKADGRWLYGACWGDFNPDFTSDPGRQEWFLRALHKNVTGFLGWGPTYPLDACRIYTMTNALAMGSMPSAGVWHRIEIPLSAIGVTTQLIDGVAFIHDERGRAWWSRTSIVEPSGTNTVLFGDSIERPASQLVQTRIRVAGLTNGTPVRVLFEDRTLTGGADGFVDDFTGRDVYQRYGGDFGLGYGAAPVALHIYEINGP